MQGKDEKFAWWPAAVEKEVWLEAINVSDEASLHMPHGYEDPDTYPLACAADLPTSRRDRQGRMGPLHRRFSSSGLVSLVQERVHALERADAPTAQEGGAARQHQGQQPGRRGLESGRRA